MSLAFGGLAVAAVGCHGCATCGVPSALRVAGPTPYVRCMGADPPSSFHRKIGRLDLELSGRELRVRHAPSDVRIAAFSGPAPARTSIDAAIARISSGHPDLVLVLGDVGDTQKVATATLNALGAIDAPSIVVAGGRDDAATLDDAFDAMNDRARDRVIDARAVRDVVIGADQLVLVSGARGGRYGRTDESCGFAPSDLSKIADALGSRPAGVQRRWLVSWMAPAGWTGAEGLAGVGAGDPDLAKLAKEVGARWGLWAWPSPEAREPAAQGRAVPSVGGVPSVRADVAGSSRRVQWLVLGPSGPRW